MKVENGYVSVSKINKYSIVFSVKLLLTNVEFYFRKALFGS